YDIQSGTHDPYEDCVATMRLYKRMRAQAHPAEASTPKFSSPTNNLDCGQVGSFTICHQMPSLRYHDRIMHVGVWI
ncbi:hypothetical protein MKX01_042541, partial [Papaver californicum]